MPSLSVQRVVLSEPVHLGSFISQVCFEYWAVWSPAPPFLPVIRPHRIPRDYEVSAGPSRPTPTDHQMSSVLMLHLSVETGCLLSIFEESPHALGIALPLIDIRPVILLIL